MSNNNVTLLKMRITEFRGYREEDFLTFLELDNPGLIELHLPRRAVLYQSSNGAFVTEYTRMALLGDRLSALGSGFSFWAPSIYAQDDFVFYVPAQDRAAVAGLLVMAQELSEIPYGVTTSYDRDAYGQLHRDFYDHACCELLVMAVQFLRMEGEEG